MKNTAKPSLLLLIVSSLLIGCSEPAKPPYQLPSDYIQLLAGDSSKTWKLARRFNNKTRMNMAGCFLSYEQTFSVNGDVRDNLEEFPDCGQSLVGSWKIVKDKKGSSYIKVTSDRIPELMNIEDDFKHFKILKLSGEEIILQFRHKQFSNKTTTITDFLVPHDADIEGRDFLGN